MPHVSWDDADNTLTVFLAPSRITDKEEERLDSGESDFFVFSGKESPDAGRWQWYPYVVTEVVFKSPEVNRKNIRSVYIKAYGIEEKNYTDNLNLSSGDAVRFEHVKFDKGDLSMKYSGESAIMDDRFQWDIEI